MVDADLPTEAQRAVPTGRVRARASPPPNGMSARIADTTRPVAMARRLDRAVLLLPGPLTVYLAFHAGGYFAGTQGELAVALAVLLIVRAALADGARPVCASLIVALAALALLAAWTLLSQDWSGAPARALLSFDNVLGYALALALFGSIRSDSRALSWVLRGLAAGGSIVCTAALVTRLLPHLWPTAPVSQAIGDQRLAFPITYWNALGLLGAMAVILCLHLSSSDREPRPVRVGAAAMVPVLVSTVYFTFSRGAIAIGLVGTLAYLLVARPRHTLEAVMTVIPLGALALAGAVAAGALAGNAPTSPAGVYQGRLLALVVALCAALAGFVRCRLDVESARMRAMTGRLPRRLGMATLGVTATLLVAGSLALGAPRWVGDQVDGFLHHENLSIASDLRSRLTDPSANGRLQLWSVAVRGLSEVRLTGHGAGTFETRWTRLRPAGFQVINAHSLYLEELSDLGLPGLVLVLLAVLALLTGSGVRIRGPDRAAFAAVLAVTLTWALHAGIDWDWQMPVLTLWPIVLGAVALAVPRSAKGTQRRPAAGSPHRLSPAGVAVRAAIVVCCAGLALTPLRIAISQQKLTESAKAFRAGNCPAAITGARGAIFAARERPEPYELLGLCDARLGFAQLAVSALERAVERDRDSWEPWYDLGLVRALAGEDPRRAIATALRLNPRDSSIQAAASTFATAPRRAWPAHARQLRLPPV